MATEQIVIPREEIAQFCRKWRISELSLFGSVLRPDFRKDSDVDVLVSFADGGGQRFGNFLEMREELSRLFDGRPVDLVETRLLKNRYRREAILSSREVVYAG